MKILIVEDEKELQNALKTSLEKEQFTIETADNYFSASEKITVYTYDCILLDITLPGGSGLDLLDLLKQHQQPGSVIIISAKNSLDDKLKGLELGADDYLTKPFHIAELNARVKAVLRRNNTDSQHILAIANTVLNITDHVFLVDDKPLELNRKEFDILNHFFLNKNRVITKTSLAEHVWGDNIDQADSFDFVYSQIKNLRKKLRQSKAKIAIESVYGVGYKLAEL